MTTPLSPERLEELAAEHDRYAEIVAERVLVQNHRAKARALRAGAAAWRIALEFYNVRQHAPYCEKGRATGPCNCGLADREQRLAALGGEGER